MTHQLEIPTPGPVTPTSPLSGPQEPASGPTTDFFLESKWEIIKCQGLLEHRETNCNLVPGDKTARLVLLLSQISRIGGIFRGCSFIFPTQPQCNLNLNSSWVWHENDFAYPTHPPPPTTETFRALLDELESWNFAQILTRPIWLR